MLPGDVFKQSGNAHFASSQPADKLVQPVTYLTAYEHGLAVFDSRDLKKGLPVFFQRKFSLPAAYTSLKCGNSFLFSSWWLLGLEWNFYLFYWLCLLSISGIIQGWFQGSFNAAIWWEYERHFRTCHSLPFFFGQFLFCYHAFLILIGLLTGLGAHLDSLSWAKEMCIVNRIKQMEML